MERIAGDAAVACACCQAATAARATAQDKYGRHHEARARNQCWSKLDRSRLLACGAVTILPPVRADDRGRLYFFHGSDEAVPPSGQRFDVSRCLRRVSQHLANPGDRVVQAVVEIHERIRGPQPGPDLFAGDEVAGRLQQQRQHLNGLPLQTQLHAAFAQFPRMQIELKRIEPQHARHRNSRCRHTFLEGQQAYHKLQVATCQSLTDGENFEAERRPPGLRASGSGARFHSLRVLPRARTQRPD